MMSIFYESALALSRVGAQESTETRELERDPQAPTKQAHVDEMENLAKKLGHMQRELGDRLTASSNGPQATEGDLMEVVKSVAQDLFDTQDGLADAHGTKLGANALSLLGGIKGR